MREQLIVMSSEVETSLTIREQSEEAENSKRFLHFGRNDKVAHARSPFWIP
jgi:hypothetical protein